MHWDFSIAVVPRTHNSYGTGSNPVGPTKICSDGVIGSRNGLKIRYLRVCRFESGSEHQT